MGNKIFIDTSPIIYLLDEKSPLRPKAEHFFFGSFKSSIYTCHIDDNLHGISRIPLPHEQYGGDKYFLEIP